MKKKDKMRLEKRCNRKGGRERENKSAKERIRKGLKCVRRTE